MNSQILLLVTLLYGAGMFFVAWRADRGAGRAGALQPLIYALALGIYCSSWTFFGAVGRASRNGWDYLPIYLGPILLFVLGWPLLRRLLVVGPRNKTTSIADFIGSRFGKSQSLAGLVTLVAVVGTLPYIALQLEAVELAWATVNGRNDGSALSSGGSTGLVTAMLMAWFAILFGTRQAESQARNRGMMMAISIESVVKLAAFMLIAWLALDWLLTNPAAAGSGQVLVNLYLGEGVGVGVGFFTQTLLAATAIICLPRQFHLLVVERHSPRDLRFARWLFPLYLGLFSLLVIPVVVAGVTLFSDTAVTPDTYVLSLPLTRGWSVPAGAAFIGGISAATGMIVVSTMTVSIMITNELLVPAWLRLNRRVAAPGASIGRHLLNIRRGSIIAVLLLSWSLQHQLANIGGLASLGLIAFAAAAQLAPGLVAALYWRRAHRYGVLAGLLAGMSLWAYTLLLPAVLRPDSALLANGPWGFIWLAPNNLLGTGFLDPLTHAVMWSLGMNVMVLWQVSRRSRFRAVDVRQARAFMQLHGEQHSRRRDLNLTSVRVAALNSLVEPLLGMDRAQEKWREFETRLGHRLLPGDRAPRFVVQEVESTLAGIIGAASAHRAMGLARSTRRLQLTDLASLVDDASQQLQFSHELLETTIETISQGISVVDADLRLVAWNKRYEEIFSFPSRLLYVGCSIRRIYEYNAERGLFGANSEDIDHEMDRRMARLRSRQTYRHERRLPNNTVIEIEGAPLVSGGFVTTYTDISDFKRVVAELEQSKQLLEQRVTERTSELLQANESLRRENSLRARVEKELADVHASKSRFLAAASHDLLQPINAARLFAAAMQMRNDNAVDAELDSLDMALGRAETLIASLREMARLDSGRVNPQRQHFHAGELLQRLFAEFSILAGDKGIKLDQVATRCWLDTDPHMLQRILQNFLSNALRYTRRGRVLLGCRRRRDGLAIEVWDTGTGIAEADRRRIFEEFERAGSSPGGDDGGLGLGLAIAGRMARLLGHQLEMDSWPGSGSVFRIIVPYGREQGGERPAAAVTDPQLSGISVLCIDDEAGVQAAMQVLLQQWGCRSVTAGGLAEAVAVSSTMVPDIVLVDYHLDAGESGLDVLDALAYHWQQRRPAIVISADDSEALLQSLGERGIAYLAKPVAPQALRSLMRRELRQYKMLRPEHD